MIDGTRDYLQAHYALNSRDDTAYWIDNRQNPNRSETLDSILSAWSSDNNVDQVLHDYTHKLAYLKTSWFCLLAGKGNFSETSSDMPDTQAPLALQARQQCDEQAQSFQFHRDYLAGIYPSDTLTSPT